MKTMMSVKQLLKRMLGIEPKRARAKKSEPVKRKKSEALPPCAASANARFYVRSEKYKGESFFKQINRLLAKYGKRVVTGWHRKNNK
jgi:hypothetical protein